MPRPGQRIAQQAQRAGLQSGRAMGRAVRGGAGLAGELIVQLDDGWYRLGFDENGLETKTPYEMNIEREV